MRRFETSRNLVKGGGLPSEVGTTRVPMAEHAVQTRNTVLLFS